MMSQKALLFNDHDKFYEIMKCIWPKDMKKKGKEVRNFVQKIWDDNKYQIVFNGNYYKFTQNQDLYNILLQSKGTTLVEASKWDKVWGIGLDIDDPRCLKRETWNGQNLLGQCLTDLREYILKSLEESTS